MSTEPYVCKLNEDGIQYLKQLLSPLIPYLSQYTTSKHLTLCTLLWSLVVVIVGYLARQNKYWMLLAIVALVGHVVTDLLDGAMSTYQDDGLEKWNFFMDHLLDFVFAISIFAGLAIYFYRRQTTLILPLFIIFTMVIINMAASFLLIVERGLDLGINVQGCFAFNIFHMHFIMMIFYTSIIVSRKRVSASWVWVIAILISVLTTYNIYNRQKDLAARHA